MARMQELVSLQNSHFADSYEVYVDYGQGQPVKMKNNEATFIDVEKFLIGHGEQWKMTANKKSTYKDYDYNLSYSVRRPSWSQYDQENVKPLSLYNSHSILTPHRSHRRLSSSSLSTPSSRIDSKVIYDELWSSTKRNNPRIDAFLNYIHGEFDNRTKQVPTERRSMRIKNSHQVPTRHSIQERIYPTINETKLCLHIAVNGMSKSLRGQIPLSNLDINRGDFGDDAGMFVDNRSFSFVGLADGAGGNRSFGINPADFSQAVLDACRHLLQKTHFHSKQLPKLILSAMEQVEARKVRGSSTLCLLALNKEEHTLTSLNIGDSGFVIYRNNEIYGRSKCTMNSNGRGPKQLFSLNDSLGVPCFINENEVLSYCSLDTMKVQKGDTIILSSDGLWDVMQADQLQQVIKRNAHMRLQNLADDLLNQAVQGYIADGRDDILIIVCRVDEL
ncbi:unnamed protein product [Adineta ricciae]|uniref:Protein phosphatase n=1 Tax=Adineta ricciae TaxID=249248 RepID=A0A815HLK0_ADIRI|nr:unnamed protein product [Adineta ricciae]CAF1355609.1 unnamed protein product [Adineta ricciae]